MSDQKTYPCLMSLLAVFALLTLINLASIAQANATEFQSKLCSELKDELQQHFGRDTFSPNDFRDDENPLMIGLKKVAAELDDKHYLRVMFVLPEELQSACIERPDWLVEKMSEEGVPDDPIVADIIDYILEFRGLDRSKPNWGLLPLPDIDFEVLTIAQFFQLFEQLPSPERWDRVNDILSLGFHEYLKKFDLSDPADLERAKNLPTQMSFERYSDETMAQILDRLTAEMNLPLK